MKKSKNLFIVLGIIAALAIGFLAGINVDYPRVGSSAVSGTIGKVKNYRNTQVSEADIELRNELVTDTATLKQLQNYLRFYYVNTVKMDRDVLFAIKEANAVEQFKGVNATKIEDFKNYEKFLSSARKNLLLALSACTSVNETDPLVLRNLLNQANNIISQLNYRERIVLEYVDVLSTFIKNNNPGQFPGLQVSHDQLALNELYTALITRDRVALKFLDKTTLFAKSKEELKVLDQEQLGGIIQQDVEKLGLMFAENEKLGGFFDAEKLGTMFFDAENLGYNNSEKLGDFHFDSEKLGDFHFDSEKLGDYWDAEKLGLFFDAESLGWF